LQPKDITSTANSTFKMLAGLLTTKDIKKQSLAIISGGRFIEEIANACPAQVEGWITFDRSPPSFPVPQWFNLPKALFNELDQFGTGTPLLLVRTCDIPDYNAQDPWPHGCTLFLPFQNPDNCGAVIRSAAAFGVARIVLLKEAAHPFLPKATRAAGPAVFQVPMFAGPSVRDIDFGQMPYFSLSAEGRKLSETNFPAAFALLPGVEGPGVPEKYRKNAVSIPMQPGVESLNAATATAVALYEWRRQQPELKK
jgi:16S rRNA (guanine527-N7)-methyltransferase